MDCQFVDHCGLIVYDIELEKGDVQLSFWFTEQLMRGDELCIDILTDVIHDLTKLQEKAIIAKRDGKQNC